LIPRSIKALLIVAAGLTCSSPTGDGSAPTVALSANPSTITAGAASTLTWSSSHATSCSASGGWSGVRSTSGSENVTPASTTAYTLACTGTGGTATQTTTVTVGGAGAPTVSLSANPTTISSGQTSTLTWGSTGADNCAASGGWAGARATSGSQPVQPTSTATYTLTCTGPGGTAGQSATITVIGAPPPGSYVYPLGVGPTGRYLVDQNDRPFLLVGDAAWSLIAEATDQEAEAYLASRQALGFTLIMVNLIEHNFSSNPPANAHGQSPFTGQAFTSPPNEAYFAHADSVIRSAAEKGIAVLLAPAYLGAGCSGEGWCVEIQAAPTTDMTAWGAFVGNRYKNYPNIVWMIGGDTDPSPAQTKLAAMVDGILSQDTNHPFTAHNSPGQMAITPWPGAAWLNVNNIYTYSNTQYEELLSTYNVAPSRPYFFLESSYENEGTYGSPGSGTQPSQQQLRAQSYWAVLSGAFGHVFGNCPIWHFGSSGGYCAGSDWQGALDDQGSVNMLHFGRLFESRHWHLLVPDENENVVTGGRGSFGTETYATAAYASDGSSIIAYLPNARTVTVNPSVLAGGTMTAAWYNPATGAVTQEPGTFATSAAQIFTPPAAGDWVLVLDDTSFGFPPPGS